MTMAPCLCRQVAEVVEPASWPNTWLRVRVAGFPDLLKVKFVFLCLGLVKKKKNRRIILSFPFPRSRSGAPTS